MISDTVAVTAHDEIPITPADLSTVARIRNAALQGFAAEGVASTSIRDVAAAAGVSPGLVQHHFGNKAGLRDAVNEYVLSVATETFRDMIRDDNVDPWAAIGDTATAWVRDNSVAIRYLARALVEGDHEASRVFDALIDVARTNWLAPLERTRALRPDADQDWAAIHAVVFNLASVLLEGAISRHLPGPFFSPEQLKRWNRATTDLYRHGIAAVPPRRPKTARA
jgi:AcrR family transcriptional regulator